MNDPTRRDGGPVLACEGLTKTFREGGQTLTVLDGVNLEIAAGDLVAIVGPSGSGKTTLLQIMGGLDDPSEGRVLIEGEDFANMGEARRGHVRNRALGFVYQFHHLLPEFTALENVAMPLLVRRMPVREASAQAAALLGRVGLGERLRHKPAQLSGGERQRAAVARALITQPALVLADEPTGNLDGRIGGQVFELMRELNRELDTALIVVTHDLDIAAKMDRVLSLEGGRLQPA